LYCERDSKEDNERMKCNAKEAELFDMKGGFHENKWSQGRSTQIL